MYTVDLNSDLGESFGRYTIGNDDKIIPLISSANVACGYHASDPVVMGKTIAMAKEAGIRVGAHPGFPDLMSRCIFCIRLIVTGCRSLAKSIRRFDYILISSILSLLR